MNRLITLHVKIAVLAAGLATLIPLSCAYAEDGTSDSFTPSMVSTASEEDTSVLNRRLLAAKKDLEQFLIFAENFNSNGDMKSVEQLQGPVDDLLKRHVDRLLLQGAEQVSLQTTRLSAEIMIIKTRLLVNLNQIGAAKTSLAEMKKRFGPFPKNMVNISGKSTMLSEATRQLDEELAKPVRTKNK
jgi:hypothetical protein